MPEIPEMELYKNHLNQHVEGKTIVQAIIYREKSINITQDEFKHHVTNKQILNIERKGKYLIFDIGNEKFLLTHMMLDGRLFLLPTDMALQLKDLQDATQLKNSIPKLPGKPSVSFILSDKSILFFCKLTLGYLHYLDKTKLNEVLASLGADPLNNSFTKEEFTKLLKGRRGMIKPWLMHQKYLAGVGNAYSNEALFEAGILPIRQIVDIKSEEQTRLFSSLINILHQSISLGGDMDEPFAPWDDFTGGYNKYFKVYDREGKECKVCNDIIKREEVGGRNAFFCTTCQK